VRCVVCCVCKLLVCKLLTPRAGLLACIFSHPKRNDLQHPGKLTIHTSYVGLARTIFMWCVYGIFGKEVAKYTVIHNNIRCIYTVLANPTHLCITILLSCEPNMIAASSTPQE